MTMARGGGTPRRRRPTAGRSRRSSAMCPGGDMSLAASDDIESLDEERLEVEIAGGAAGLGDAVWRPARNVVQTFTCQLCGKTFGHRKSLWRHQVSVHGRMRKQDLQQQLNQKWTS